MGWQYCSPIPVGRRGVTSSFELFYLPHYAWGGGGGRQQPVIKTPLAGEKRGGGRERGVGGGPQPRHGNQSRPTTPSRRRRGRARTRPPTSSPLQPDRQVCNAGTLRIFVVSFMAAEMLLLSRSGLIQSRNLKSRYGARN
jgi:hypothetical protein